MLLGNYNYSQDRSFLKGNEENPALVLSNVHNRTSARDGPMFGSKGPSMNTSSLGQTRRVERGMGDQYFGRREKYDCPLTVKYVHCAPKYSKLCTYRYNELSFS
jgi:hypothetical protein